MICHNTIQLKQTFKVKNFYPSYRIQANSTVWQFFTHFWHVKVLSVNIAKGIYLGGLFSSPRKVAIVRGNFGKQNGVIRDRIQYQYYFFYMLYASPDYTFCQYRQVGRQVGVQAQGPNCVKISRTYQRLVTGRYYYCIAFIFWLVF